LCNGAHTATRIRKSGEIRGSWRWHVACNLWRGQGRPRAPHRIAPPSISLGLGVPLLPTKLRRADLHSADLSEWPLIHDPARSPARGISESLEPGSRSTPHLARRA